MSSHFSSASVLVVDDSYTMRRIIKNILEKIGMGTIHEASNGKEALEILNRGGVDILITDWNMPEMDGLALVKAVRSSDKFGKLPILMVTTENAKDDILNALRSGVDNYAVKPFTQEVIEEKVSKLLGITN